VQVTEIKYMKLYLAIERGNEQGNGKGMISDDGVRGSVVAQSLI
jgi:hypothetical protein